VAKRKVIWTAIAAKQRREILRYWTNRNGSPAYAEKLIKLTAKRINIILKHPEAYRTTVYPETRISAMGHFSILYKLTGSHLIVTAFWDNRQGPNKLLEIIET
jgi:plasmid stabilization system protein ParE